LLVRPGETESDAFIHAGEDILSPPCFNFRPLDLFLQRAQLGDLTNCNPSPRQHWGITRSWTQLPDYKVPNIISSARLWVEGREVSLHQLDEDRISQSLGIKFIFRW
jgi:hypothetical protein